MTPRSLVVAALAVLATGCSSLLDLAPGTPVDPAPPSCATGWAYRVPIEIENTAGATLARYQVEIPLDLRSAIAAGKLAASAADLRFAVDDDTPPLAFAASGDLARAAGRAWVAVPELAGGTTRIYAYYGNPDAPAWDGPSPFVPDIVFNPSFETTGGWTQDVTNGAFELSSTWASDGDSSLAVDGYRAAASKEEQVLGVSQIASFPPGSDYALVFDLDVIAASNGGIGGDSNGGFFVSAGNGLVEVWTLDGAAGNITGEYRDVKTAPFGPGSLGISFGVTLNPGHFPSYAKGFFDHIRVVQHVTPEPAVHVGSEQDACAP